MLLLIDADSAFYRAGFANETREYLCTLDGELMGTFQYKKDADAFAEEHGCDVEQHSEAGPVGLSLYNLRNCIDSMLSLSHTGYEMYYGGKGNYRYDVFPEYKANRKDVGKPKHLEQMKKHLQAQCGAIPVDGEEADDRVSWRQMQCIEEGIESCIVTIDKDLDNTPGWHFNWVKGGDPYYVSPEQADLNFYRQLLTGDKTDGIPGIPGLGKKTAEKILPEWSEDMLDIVMRTYKDKDLSMEYLKQQGVALWMRRKPNEMWSYNG